MKFNHNIYILKEKFSDQMGKQLEKPLRGHALQRK